MTTIVFDGKHLAADKRGTLGPGVGIHKRHCPDCGTYLKITHTVMDKIHVPEKTVIFENEKVIALAGAGLYSMFKYMMYIIESHPDPLEAIRKFSKTDKQENTTILILTEQNVYTLNASGRLIMHNELPVAIGTGDLAAKLAIKQGSSAMEAVIAASLVDEATSDVVDYINVVPSEKFEIQRFKPKE